MGLFAQADGQSAQAPLPSNLFPMLFERLRLDKRLVVMDVGPATRSTVAFFNHFKCRLNFVDLYSADFVVNPLDEINHEELVAQFQTAFNLPAGSRIDICLFWDFFTYLAAPVLKAFLEALDPYIDRGTRGHALGILNARNGLPFCQYGIHSMDKLHQTAMLGKQLPVHLHSQRDLNDMLGYFEIGKSRLMSDGRVEYFLLENRDQKANPNAYF
ncbi:hypothetical protein N2382_11405 [SAR92 clade bacterium H921]|jgi:hypothetical protein|nr:hypothetical protein [SAR92 clade bacterium H921]MDG0971564.1 hypothetical protein [Porticoccaceae bacterium]MDG1307612.1 hypothetical protein [Porticoccaceae bacterium]